MKSTHQLFGPWLRKERITQGITLPDLATKAGISKGGLSKIERGADLQLSTMTKLLHALNCDHHVSPPVRSPLPL